MFDDESAAVLLGGKSGPMDTGHFIELVNRNKRVDNVRWQRDSKAEQISHLCTITVGDPAAGDARNVPTPSIPEFTQFIDKEARVGIVCRGWRSLLSMFILDGWLYPSGEIRQWLGDPMWDQARRFSPCR